MLCGVLLSEESCKVPERVAKASPFVREERPYVETMLLELCVQVHARKAYIRVPAGV